MRNFKSRLATLIIFIALLGSVLGGCEKTATKTGSLIDFVPQQAVAVFKISNLENLHADIKANSLLSTLDEVEPYSLLKEQKTLFANLRPNSQSLLCINKVNDSVSAFTFISKYTENLLQTDSIKNKSVETLKLNEQTIKRITIENKTSYSTVIDSVFVLSSSQQILQDILNGKTESGATFRKVFNLPSSNPFTALLRNNKLALTNPNKTNFTSWSTLDIAITPESFTATGITLATDTIPQLLNIFEEQIPQQNDVSALVPADALGALSFTFNDAEAFQKKLQHFRGEKIHPSTTGLFGSASEAGSIKLKNDTVLFVKSIDPSLTNDALARYLTSESIFRDVEISRFNEPNLFATTFSPLITFAEANFAFQLDNFFVFTQSESAAETVISAYLNNYTLKNASYFENTATDLSSASSLLIFNMQGSFLKEMAVFFNAENTSELNKTSYKKYPLTALQFNYDRNFAHINLSCKEANNTIAQNTTGVVEKFNLKLDSPLLSTPQIIESKNGSVNVVVQDLNNTLHYISESGKTLWTKSLKTPILGNVTGVQINNATQLAFTTENAFYIIDRNGNDLKGFPINFKDKITQPLAVFDYDNNKKYRFVVVQNNEVLMYDKKGDRVRGFGFKGTKSTILHPPKHIRMGNKDYIVITEESGKLNILSRVGKHRVKVLKNFNFSAIPVAEEDNHFVVITKENTKERITQNGKVSSQKLNVNNSYWYSILENTKATIDDNLLRINGKLVELPLGIYSNPQVFSIKRKKYITITETQENKVYVYSQTGKLLNGFPVYGTSAASIGAGNNKALVVKGETNIVLFYTF